MNSNKILNVQIINTHDTESNWKQIENDFVPFDGEMIVYSPDEGHVNSRIKIGNGEDTLAQLNFFTGNIIKTKTTPGANNNNTQTIYQVVDNSDKVINYWYYSNGGWRELGTGSYTQYTQYTLTDVGSYILTKPNRSTIQIVLEKEYGHYRFDMSQLDFSTASQNDTCKLIIKSSYPNVRCVLYTNTNNTYRDIEQIQIYSYNGFVINNGYSYIRIGELINNNYSAMHDNYILFDDAEISSSGAIFKLDYDDGGDCQITVGGQNIDIDVYTTLLNEQY